MITAERLRELLRYDPETGHFWWLKTGMGRRTTQPAGYIANGYVSIMIEGDLYLGHRLAWLYTHGEWPPGLIDHRKHDRADNRIAEIRLADHRLNGANRRRNANKTTPFKGVVFYKQAKGPNPWGASIKINGKQHHLGVFATAEEAARAYDARARAVWGDHAHTNF